MGANALLQELAFANANVNPPSPPEVAPPGPVPTTAPPTISPPAPPPTEAPSQGNVQASNIRCLQSTSREQLTARLRLRRPLVAPPVLALRPAVNPLTSSVCTLTSAEEDRLLTLSVTNLEACGVESCVQPSGERWLCLTIRFPVIAGIRLPEDDVIQIQCRPQDPTQTRGKQLAVPTVGLELQSPALFSGGEQQFECEIALFRRTPGTGIFSTVVQAGDAVTLGEELHLRAIIRSDDGWRFSRLTDVLLQRVTADGVAQTADSVSLVLSSGCRNPEFKIVAPAQPTRHQQNQLISNFAFRVFAFQGMGSGDRLQVSAGVTGCVEAIDCAPTACPDGGQGYGRRRRREARVSNSTDWRRDLAFSVLLPDVPPAETPPRGRAPKLQCRQSPLRLRATS
ncbi:uncharacterized protein LOC119114071 [Pollicipes pollicipes]|uniref:uncharacterized protein LOC119114071 n=1 Tax=Pollicipes pollicipes TaxID=41117 RepID=UPI001884B9F6|nr:uncharacterized protein LOC119114071 [Pollicipes pollicipes]